jgi:hypothetical protein
MSSSAVEIIKYNIKFYYLIIFKSSKVQNHMLSKILIINNFRV